MVLEHLILYPQLAVGGHIQIRSDSQTTVGIISQGWKSYSYKNTIEEIKMAIKTLTLKRITVELLWIPGHAGLQGNEKADQLAKEGAEEARSMPEEKKKCLYPGYQGCQPQGLSCKMAVRMADCQYRKTKVQKTI